MKMQDFSPEAREPCSGRACASARSNCGSVSPTMPKPPIWSNCRRVTGATGSRLCSNMVRLPCGPFIRAAQAAAIVAKRGDGSKEVDAGGGGGGIVAVVVGGDFEGGVSEGLVVGGLGGRVK